MKAADCPSNEHLTAFVLGKLPEETLEKLAAHTASCRQCQSRLQSADQLSDNLIAQIRQAPPTDALDKEPELSRLLKQAVPEDTISDLRGILAPPQGTNEIGRLGAYRVVRILGAGGMGLVMQAEDVKLHRQVALKIMKPEVAADPTARQRFLQEARATAALRSDHIVTIYQVGEDGSVPFLAMEFLQGETLESYLARMQPANRGGRLPIADVLRIGREVAEGLAAAHESGLIHRDIKPANIWLDKERGRVKLLDFGLARSLEADIHLTQTGHVLGTPSYMSPEQAHGKPADPRSDLFSLGTVLYEMCTSVCPFRRETTFDTLMAVASDTPKPVGELNPNVPPAVAELVTRLMAKKSEDRPATAREVADALRSLKKSLTQHSIQQPRTQDTRAVPTTRPSALPPATGGRRLAPVAAVAFLLLGLAVGSAYFFLSQKGTSTTSTPPTESAERTTTAATPAGIEVPPGPADDAFVRWVAGLPEEQRYVAVLQKLKELNPRFTKTYTYTLAEKKIWLKSDGLTDLSPLRALPELRILHCHGSARGKGTITDLSPIKDLKLTVLLCHWNQITDLSPIRDMPLETLWCDIPAERDMDFLKSLVQQKDAPRRINGKPARQFLKEPVPPPAKQ